MTEKVSQATLLVGLALDTDGLELFRTPNHDAQMLVPQGTHRECWPIGSTAFRRWLQRLYFEQTGTGRPKGLAALGEKAGLLGLPFITTRAGLARNEREPRVAAPSGEGRQHLGAEQLGLCR
jgi:hypothetical protein